MIFFSEKERMCSQIECNECMLEENGSCRIDISTITQKHIEFVQKWSDEHPIMTRRDKFINLMEENGFEEFAKQVKSIKCQYFDKGNGVPCAMDNCNRCMEYWNKIVE